MQLYLNEHLQLNLGSVVLTTSTAEMISGSHPTLYKLYISNLNYLTIRGDNIMSTELREKYRLLCAQS
jgi:hypothetical protein